MRPIAYLASRLTLPGAADRRKDAFEHDATMDALVPAFAAEGMALQAVAWDADADWRAFDAVIVGTTWDYWDRHAEFLAALRGIAEVRPLFNAPELVAWNTHKRYLAELAARGAPSIPTVWLDAPDAASVEAAFEELGADDLVVKRQVGAGAFGQVRLRRGEAVPAMPHAMLAQPFLPAIATEGELSFVVIDGALSHALVKRAAAGDYRIQSLYGGVEAVYEPSPQEAELAVGIVALLDEVPLYARVDLVRDADGGLKLMELEMVEPYLYPLQGPELGPRMAAATRRRLG